MLNYNPIKRFDFLKCISLKFLFIGYFLPFSNLLIYPMIDNVFNILGGVLVVIYILLHILVLNYHYKFYSDMNLNMSCNKKFIFMNSIVMIVGYILYIASYTIVKETQGLYNIVYSINLDNEVMMLIGLMSTIVVLILTFYATLMNRENY